MNFGELKNRVRNFGFEEQEAIEEYGDIIRSAVNTALHTIATTVTPLLAHYELHQDGSGSGSKWYDMRELTREDGEVTFLSFADTPVRTEDYEAFDRFQLEDGHILVLDRSLSGDFSVFYKRTPKRVTTGTPDSELLDVDARMEAALPHLVAYYVWMDDDERKAQRYRNEFDELKAEVLAETQRPRARIIGGF